jgi:hypothetical protein
MQHGGKVIFEESESVMQPCLSATVTALEEQPHQYFVANRNLFNLPNRRLFHSDLVAGL